MTFHDRTGLGGRLKHLALARYICIPSPGSHEGTIVENKLCQLLAPPENQFIGWQMQWWKVVFLLSKNAPDQQLHFCP